MKWWKNSLLEMLTYASKNIYVASVSWKCDRSYLYYWGGSPKKSVNSTRCFLVQVQQPKKPMRSWLLVPFVIGQMRKTDPWSPWEPKFFPWAWGSKLGLFFQPKPQLRKDVPGLKMMDGNQILTPIDIQLRVYISNVFYDDVYISK